MVLPDLRRRGCAAAAQVGPCRHGAAVDRRPAGPDPGSDRLRIRGWPRSQGARTARSRGAGRRGEAARLWTGGQPLRPLLATVIVLLVAGAAVVVPTRPAAAVGGG